ncbi:conserved hypothetical protein [Aspergillus fumigatus A1163]|uniref:Uncharacterized protein n=1 Tax=Aspergillus fumigatus (strain CBS 144.89 / FGSC A1163 / CEA10) TaxID=451804 RepID=B0Y8J6_ASPFC|nr:conserved hypothetical protein [Aspergillus fumigatus A1163]
MSPIKGFRIKSARVYRSGDLRVYHKLFRLASSSPDESPLSLSRNQKPAAQALLSSRLEAHSTHELTASTASPTAESKWKWQVAMSITSHPYVWHCPEQTSKNGLRGGENPKCCYLPSAHGEVTKNFLGH